MAHGAPNSGLAYVCWFGMIYFVRSAHDLWPVIFTVWISQKIITVKKSLVITGLWDYFLPGMAVGMDIAYTITRTTAVRPDGNAGRRKEGRFKK